MWITHRNRAGGALNQRPNVIVLLSAATMLVAGAAACGPNVRAPESQAIPATARQLTSLEGVARNPRFSPDGERIVFSLATPARTELWVVPLRDGQARQLTSTNVREAFPAWSPDGRSIAYAATNDGVTGIWAIPADGGVARPLFVRAGMSAFSPDFAPDGRIAFTVVQRDSTRTWGNVSTWVMRADGSEARRITSGGDTWHARWDARGEWLHYYVGQSDELRMVNAATGEDRNVDGGRFMGWMPSPSPRGEHLAFISSPGWSVWTAGLSPAGGLVQLSRAGDARFPSFSPDGNWLTFSRTPAPRIEMVDLATGDRTHLGTGTGPQPAAHGEFTFVSATAIPGRAMITVERGRRAAREVPSGIADLAEFSLASSGAIAATSSGGAQPPAGLQVIQAGEKVARQVAADRIFTPRWCGPDSSVVFTARVGEFWQVVRQDLATGAREQLTSTSSGKQLTGCAADGSWITYQTYGGAVMTGVARRDGGSWASTERRGWSTATLSPDGRSTAYVQVGSDGFPDLYLRDATGSVRRLTNDRLVESSLAFSSDGAAIAFESRATNEDIWIAPVPRLPGAVR